MQSATKLSFPPTLHAIHTPWHLSYPTGLRLPLLYSLVWRTTFLTAFRVSCFVSWEENLFNFAWRLRSLNQSLQAGFKKKETLAHPGLCPERTGACWITFNSAQGGVSKCRNVNLVFPGFSQAKKQKATQGKACCQLGLSPYCSFPICKLACWA